QAHRRRPPLRDRGRERVGSRGDLPGPAGAVDPFAHRHSHGARGAPRLIPQPLLNCPKELEAGHFGADPSPKRSRAASLGPWAKHPPDALLPATSYLGTEHYV